MVAIKVRFRNNLTRGTSHTGLDSTVVSPAAIGGRLGFDMAGGRALGDEAAARTPRRRARR